MKARGNRVPQPQGREKVRRGPFWSEAPWPTYVYCVYISNQLTQLQGYIYVILFNIRERKCMKFSYPISYFKWTIWVREWQLKSPKKKGASPQFLRGGRRRGKPTQSARLFQAVQPHLGKQGENAYNRSLNIYQDVIFLSYMDLYPK